MASSLLPDLIKGCVILLIWYVKSYGAVPSEPVKVMVVVSSIQIFSLATDMVASGSKRSSKKRKLLLVEYALSSIQQVKNKPIKNSLFLKLSISNNFIIMLFYST